MLHQRIEPRWTSCIVAASGPSLSEDIAPRARGHHVIAVNDAYRVLPFADVLYACDERWWDVHRGCPDFKGEKWSSHNDDKGGNNHKIAAGERYGLNLVRGVDREGFSFDPSAIHYGSNSGFQAINLAILFGAKQIFLVGFDMKAASDKTHFFGDHPPGLTHNRNYERFIPNFERAAKLLPPEIEIINCTPGSALRCFPMSELPDALSRAA